MHFAWNRAAFPWPRQAVVQIAAFFCRDGAKRGLAGHLHKAAHFPLQLRQMERFRFRQRNASSGQFRQMPKVFGLGANGVWPDACAIFTTIAKFMPE